MKKLNDLRNIIFEKNYKIIILENKIDVVNYQEIIDINHAKIELKINNKILKIYGENLAISKLLNEEILITGTITKLEIG